MIRTKINISSKTANHGAIAQKAQPRRKSFGKFSRSLTIQSATGDEQIENMMLPEVPEESGGSEKSSPSKIKHEQSSMHTESEEEDLLSMGSFNKS